ncbi:MAG: flagellar basal body rod C-terminal domain-containing protein, partial [Syntrophobacteraceae bacterium]
VTQDGWPVLGRNGPIRIENTHNMRFGEDGQVFDGDTPVDTLDIVQFPAGTQLRKIQGGYFEPESKDVQPAKAESCIVVNESLEGANFNPVEEMVRMVETMRSFEAYQKTMKIFDRDLDAQIIAKLSG